MANVNFTDLPSAPSATVSDIYTAVQSGSNVQITGKQIIDLVKADLVVANAGDPNGNLAGVTYDLCWDNSNNNLYICTVSGTSATATWTLIAEDLGALTDGQLLIGNSATGIPNKANISAGTNILVTNSSGGIEISATGLAAFSWNEVTTTSDNMIGDNGYQANNASLVTLTLPTSAVFGDEIIVVGKGSGGFRIAQNAGQTIYSNLESTTTGVSGYIDGNQHCTLSLIALDATTNDWVLKSSTGILTFN